MDNARVGLFEDYPAMQEVIKDWLAHSGHAVVLEAHSLPEAVLKIEASEPGSLDVALVDADLGINHDEGAEVVKKLREKMGGIAIIGISLGQENIEGVDKNISKGKIDKIVEYIDNL